MEPWVAKSGRCLKVCSLHVEGTSVKGHVLEQENTGRKQMKQLEVYVLIRANCWPVPESSCASCWNFLLAPGHGRSAVSAARWWTCVDSCCLGAWGAVDDGAQEGSQARGEAQVRAPGCSVLTSTCVPVAGVTVQVVQPSGRWHGCYHQTVGVQSWFRYCLVVWAWANDSFVPLAVRWG